MDEDGIRPLAEIRGEVEGLIAAVRRVETTGNGGLENWETMGRIRELAERLPHAKRARVLQRIKDIPE